MRRERESGPGQGQSVSRVKDGILEPANVRGATGISFIFVPLYSDARTGLGSRNVCSSLAFYSFALFNSKSTSIFLFPKRPRS